jgi:hypothetical protein
MKNYTYYGTSNLTFTHGDRDYLVTGAGPHELPEEADIVQSHVSRGTLIEEGTEDTNDKIKNKK